MIILENIHIPFPEFTMNITLHIRSGEKIAIFGASGAGKSTLLNLIAGFIFAQNGKIILNGYDHSKTLPHKRPISILFQNNNLFEHLNVFQNMAIGLQPSLKLSDTEQEKVQEIACQVGLQNYLSRLPAQLSGGQRQRVALARSLLRNKPILLLDEPFSALDKPLRQEMLALLQTIYRQKQLTLIMVTHQPDELKDFADRFFQIENGNIVQENLNKQI